MGTAVQKVTNKTNTMTKETKKVDKRTKEYRDSLKKLPKIEDVKFTSRATVKSNNPAFKLKDENGYTSHATKLSQQLTGSKESRSHLQMIEGLQQECRSLNDEIAKLFERLTKLETTVG